MIGPDGCKFRKKTRDERREIEKFKCKKDPTCAGSRLDWVERCFPFYTIGCSQPSAAFQCGGGKNHCEALASRNSEHLHDCCKSHGPAYRAN